MKLALLRMWALGALLGLVGCQRAQLTADELASYVNDPTHKLKQVQQVGPVEVSVIYQPTDLLVGHELGGAPAEGQATVDSLRHKYRHGTFFVLAIARNQQEVLQPKEGFANYSELLQTLAFRMDQHVRLITSQGDTLRPTNYFLDRTYASASATQLLFAFPRLPAAGTWQFQLQECGLSTGNLTFPFDAARVQNAPTLAIAN